VARKRNESASLGVGLAVSPNAAIAFDGELVSQIPRIFRKRAEWLYGGKDDQD
jgi:hypothetical protein